MTLLEFFSDIAPGRVTGSPAGSRDEEQCLVFSTSLQTEEDVNRISDTLNRLPGILEWSVDLEDWEKVLRVEVSGVDAGTIMSVLRERGVFTREMDT